ncbi:hypothetical protein [Caulobacter soli]|uniref:hypothetical protein n=1 Tax=Caulobacter soli TaxID=2708539 RepID=UPI0013ED02F8|nr:hypothetical protein [Caulobacter soli]
MSGCASHNLLRVDGAGPAVENPKIIEAVNLTVALNPAGLPPRGQIADCLKAETLPEACKAAGSNVSAKSLLTLLGFGEASSASRKDDRLTQERMRLEAALAAFYEPLNDDFGPAEDRRDRLQARLLGASDANCATFAQTIYGTQASSNFIFGGLATSLAGAGAITTNQQTARLLSGLAGISSGLRTEANEDFFRKQWMEAVVKAINTSRDKMRADMTVRQAQSISDYPVEAAIADAIRYNGECSLVAGMKEVNSAVTIADDPAGMKALKSTFSQAGYKVDFNLRGRVDDPAVGATDGPAPTERREVSGRAGDAILKLNGAVQRAQGRAHLLVEQTKADYKAKNNKDMPAADVAALQGKLDAITAPLDYGAPNSTTKQSFDNLAKFATDAAKLNAELAQLPASKTAERSDKQAEIRANDAQAAAELALALHRVNSADQALGKVVAP